AAPELAAFVAGMGHRKSPFGNARRRHEKRRPRRDRPFRIAPSRCSLFVPEERDDVNRKVPNGLDWGRQKRKFPPPTPPASGRGERGHNTIPLPPAAGVRGGPGTKQSPFR